MISKNNKQIKSLSIFKGLSLAFLVNSIFIPHLIQINYHPFSSEVLLFFISLFIPMYILGYFINWKFYLLISALSSYWFLDSYFIKDEHFYILIIFLIIFFCYINFLDKFFFPKTISIFCIFFILFSIINFKSEILINEKLIKNENNNITNSKFSYLHIILDEHSSLNLLPEEFKDESFNRKFENNYISNNFKIYNSVFSESPNTRKSLGAIFGLYDDKEVKKIRIGNYEQKNNKFTYSIKKNILTERLKKNNLEVSFIQSTYLEICDKLNSYKCETYNRAANMHIFKIYNIGIVQRLKIAALSLHQNFYHKGHEVFLYKKIINIFNKNELRSYGYFSRPLVNLYIFDKIKDRVKNLKKGEALIAHMMLPHFPYVLDENCNLKKIKDWNYPLRHNKNETKLSAHIGFLEQTKCTHKKVSSILEIASKKDNLIVVIHGDHGARLFLNTKLENKIDNMSTFVALKGIGTVPEVIEKNLKLQNVFIKFFNKYF